MRYHITQLPEGQRDRYIGSLRVRGTYPHDSPIAKHINNALREELDGEPVVAKFATPKKYGRKEGYTQMQNIDYYNLDMIISVGYRVKSRASVWANVLEEGQEKARKGQENISNDQKRPNSAQIDCGTTQKTYPENLPGNCPEATH